MLRRVSQQHGREIKSIHHGVDKGKGFLKFDLTIEFQTESKSPISDHGRHRVLMIAITPEVE